MCISHNTYTEVQLRDSYVAGYMHATCGHDDDLTPHMFGSRDTYTAWSTGYSQGTAELVHVDPLVNETWTNETVTKALGAWHKHNAVGHEARECACGGQPGEVVA